MLFAGIMLAIIGVLNVIYGIAAVGDSKFYVRDVEYVFANLNTWGWLLIGRRRGPADHGVRGLHVGASGRAGSGSGSPPPT